MTGSTSELRHPASLTFAATPPRVATAAPLRRRSPGSGTLVGRTALLIVVAAAIIVGVHLGRPDAAAATDPDLARLLRFMALMKAGLACVAIAALFWRLAEPVTPLRLAGYLIAVGASVSGPGMIWSMDHLVLGAVLLHGGLAALVVLLWRDPATAARLARLTQSGSGAPQAGPGRARGETTARKIRQRAPRA